MKTRPITKSVLTLLRMVDKTRGEFICECGNRKTVKISDIKRGFVRSCGCNRYKECVAMRMSRTPIYRTWSDMRRRCNNPNSQVYRHYGGRGIKVCDRWMESFINFYEDMGDKPVGSSLERIDNDGDYEPSNCIWLPKSEQPNNTRRTVLIEYGGVTMNAKRWSKKLGVPYLGILRRCRQGKSGDEIFGEMLARKWCV